MLRNEVLGVTFVPPAALAIMPPTNRAPALNDAAREVIGAAPLIDPSLIKTVGAGIEAIFGLFIQLILKRLRKCRAILRRVGVFAVMLFTKDACAILVRLKSLGYYRLRLC